MKKIIFVLSLLIGCLAVGCKTNVEYVEVEKPVYWSVGQSSTDSTRLVPGWLNVYTKDVSGYTFEVINHPSDVEVEDGTELKLGYYASFGDNIFIEIFDEDCKTLIEKALNAEKYVPVDEYIILEGDEKTWLKNSLPDMRKVADNTGWELSYKDYNGAKDALILTNFPKGCKDYNILKSFTENNTIQPICVYPEKVIYNGKIYEKYAEQSLSKNILDILGVDIDEIYEILVAGEYKVASDGSRITITRAIGK